jgi:hypothetical protein
VLTTLTLVTGRPLSRFFRFPCTVILFFSVHDRVKLNFVVKKETVMNIVACGIYVGESGKCIKNVDRKKLKYERVLGLLCLKHLK